MVLDRWRAEFLRNGVRGDQLGEQFSVVWLYSDWTSGSLRRTSRIIFEYGVSRGGSGTKLATGVRWRPLSLTHFSIFCIGRSVSFTTVRDWTKLKCLSRLCPIAPADLPGTA
jgi:hypothetical protein